ncbi:hypothetical protein ACTQ4P_05490 [Clostridium sporogenes]|nr:hypothetical protein [Clostridium botulinum]
MGRKRKEIDWELYDKLKAKGLKDIQIAIKFKISQSYLCQQKRLRRENKK